MHSLAAGIGDSDDVTTALFTIAQRARGVDIVDRVVTMHMHGTIDRDADLWLIPSQP